MPPIYQDHPPNKRGAGKGGIPSVFHTGRAWPALPDRDLSQPGRRIYEQPASVVLGLLFTAALLAGCIVRA